jgi:hypothetical protein
MNIRMQQALTVIILLDTVLGKHPDKFVAHGSIRIDYNSVVVGGEDETNNLGLEQLASTTWTLPCGCLDDRIVDGTQGAEQSAHVDRTGYSSSSNYGGQHSVANDALQPSGLPLPRSLQG